MTKIERMNPRWRYTYECGHGRLTFETKTSDGAVSLSIQDGFDSIGTSSPISYKGLVLRIALYGCVIFNRYYAVEYRSGWFGGPEKPRYSKEYLYLKGLFREVPTRA